MEKLSTGGLEAQSVAVEAVLAAADRAAALAVYHNNLARDSAGQVNPQFLFASRFAGRLACGEVAVEPRLGLARVAAVLPSDEANEGDNGRESFVRIGWSDDNGPCHAAGRYRKDRPLSVRVPSYADRIAVRRDIDRAERAKREISGAIARLIAAHIHGGPRSAVYGFAVNGAVPDQLFDELDHVSAHQPAYRPWVSALARFCLGREDFRPVTGWGPSPPVPASPAKPTSDAELYEKGCRRTAGTRAVVGPLASRQLPAETAIKLMDAAFALGLAASRSEALAAKARMLACERAAAAERRWELRHTRHQTASGQAQSTALA